MTIIARISSSFVLLMCARELASAQVSFTEHELELANRPFQQKPSLAAMDCMFRAIDPRLTFALHLEAGFRLRLRLNNFDVHSIQALISFRSQSNPVNPIRVTRRYNVASASNTATDQEIVDTYEIGYGDWQVEAFVTANNGNTCRGQWVIHADPPPLAPAAGSPDRGRVTVFLNAMPLPWGASTMRPDDIGTLVQVVLGLISRLGDSAVRLVVFNLDQEAEFLRCDAFTAQDAPTLERLLQSLQLGTVDYRSLRSRIGPAAFLTRLVRKEVGQAQFILFLGPLTHTTQPVPKRLVDGTQDCMPSLIYLQYWGYRCPGGTLPTKFGAGGAECLAHDRSSAAAVNTPYDVLILPDAIENLMRRLHGHTVTFSSPYEWARALDC
jgi:hypothetical protein